MKTLKLLILLILNTICPVNAQETGTDYWTILTPEFRLNTKKFEFRFRPYDYFIITNPQQNTKTIYGRTDFMAAVTHKKLKFFLYSKFETRGKTFLGPRVDYNTSFFSKKLLFHLQYRYFWGLNANSADHQYFISVVQYNFNKYINPGFFALNKQTFNGSFLMFYGPSVNIRLTKNLGILASYMKDVNTRSRYMGFIRLNIRFKSNGKGETKGLF